MRKGRPVGIVERPQTGGFGPGPNCGWGKSVQACQGTLWYMGAVPKPVMGAGKEREWSSLPR